MNCERLGMPRERLVYVGDGSSDMHVMLHVNRRRRADDRGFGERATSRRWRGER